MAIYFDETIFTDARSLSIDGADDDEISVVAGKLKNSHIIVSNRADKYLIEQRHNMVADNKPCRTIESILDNDDNSRICDIININPKIPCIGSNIYTMNMTNAHIQQVEKFNQIEIIENEDIPTTFIDLEEYNPDTVYQLSHKLTAFESAIMIKYYAINNSNVKITRLLGNAIYRYFVDKRSWFKHSPNGIIQNHYSELLLNGELVDIPLLDISGPSISLV